MRINTCPVRRALLAALLLCAAPPVFAQTAVDPSGHWVGAIHVPPFNGAGAREIAVEIDLAKNASGRVDGRFTQARQNVKGLPLASVTVDGRSIAMELKVANGGGIFRGTVSASQSIAGEFVTAEGGYNIPFDLERTGEARIAPPPKSAPVGKELEGRWSGAIDVGGKSERLMLTITNNSDGTASGSIIDVDGSNVEIPVAMTQQASSVTIEVAPVGATYKASLNANELVGTWTQGTVVLPLTFKRASQ